jgi:hypothetical protein
MVNLSNSVIFENNLNKIINSRNISSYILAINCHYILLFMAHSYHISPQNHYSKIFVNSRIFFTIFLHFSHVLELQFVE